MSDLEMLEMGLRALLEQEAQAEAALEQARRARIMQEGAIQWERERQKREEAKRATPEEGRG